MRLVITPEPATLIQFQKLKNVLEIFIQSTPDLDKYLDHVIGVTDNGTSEEMYPVN